MLRPRVEVLHVRLGEPGTYLRERQGGGHRAGQNGTMGHEAQEPDDDEPWDRNRLGAVEKTFPPCTRDGVLGSIAVVRVDQQVQVRNDHRCAFAMNSSTS